MNQDPERTPVIVGVGQINDRPENPAEGMDSLGLMLAALDAADSDAGGGWLRDMDRLDTVAQISWPSLTDVLTPICERFSADPAHRETTPYAMGDSPVKLLNDAANAIGAGESRIAAVVGGEALRTAAWHARQAGEANRDSTRAASSANAPDYRRRYGLVAPVDVYPLYENAGRAARGETLAQGQAESAEIWAGFAEVARDTPGAWLRKGAEAEEIRTPSAGNRPIAHPYLKLMVANASVNQGAGFIVASLAEARRRGVPEDRLVFVGHGAAAHEPSDILARDGYARSVSMEASLTRALKFNGLAVEDLDHVELYSCFPCVPKLARRAIGWPLDRRATVFGGLTFGGGPIGNYMSHPIVCMTQALRERGRFGLLFGNGGFATRNHTIALSSRPFPEARFPRSYDVQAEADAARGAVPPVDETHEGPAEIETYTVLYDRQGAPRFGVVVARTPRGARTLARVPADRTADLDALTDGAREPVGRVGEIARDPSGDMIWRFA